MTTSVLDSVTTVTLDIRVLVPPSLLCSYVKKALCLRLTFYCRKVIPTIGVVTTVTILTYYYDVSKTRDLTSTDLLGTTRVVPSLIVPMTPLSER